MTVRPASKADLEHWLDMRNTLWPESSADNRAAIEAFFAGISTEIQACFVVVQPHKPVGFIELNIRNYAEGSDSGEVPYVEGWFVDASQRGKGLGKSLMAQAEHWAKQKGYSELASDAELDNGDSIAAHRKLGFAETHRIVCFLKRLK